MGSEDQFCIKFTGFNENIQKSFAVFRSDQDFLDVTLACEGKRQIKAHKWILVAYSTFFKDILENNKHPHPLIYISGIHYKHMVSLLDFIYNGEVNVYKEELSDFLDIANELEIKGMTGTDQEDKILTEDVPLSQLIEDLPQTTSRDFHAKKDTINLDYPKELFQVPYNPETLLSNDSICWPTISVTSMDYYDLDAKILNMMEKIDGAWTCKECGKYDGKFKNNIKKHIENSHIEGASHPCKRCGKKFRSRFKVRRHALHCKTLV
jgi:hypothetical protein